MNNIIIILTVLSSGGTPVHSIVKYNSRVNTGGLRIVFSHDNPLSRLLWWPWRESLSRPFSIAICSIPFKPRLKSFQNHLKSSFLMSFHDLKTTTSGLSRFCRTLFLTSNFGKCQGAGVSIQNSKLRGN